ncbi:MAG: type II toxin-antitoxin system HicB family antitoxin [Patescibacteria group bacterium]
MKNQAFTFRIEKDENEFHVWCPQLSGCHSHGKTRAEALKNLKDAIALYLEDLAEEDLLLPTSRTQKKELSPA